MESVRVIALLLTVGLVVASCAGADNRSSAERGDGPSPTVIDRLPEPGTTAWVEVPSSNLEAIRYNEFEEELDVRFLSGSTYRYFGVPPAIYGGLLDPPGGSHGEYFWDYIRNEFPYERL